MLLGEVSNSYFIESTVAKNVWLSGAIAALVVYLSSYFYFRYHEISVDGSRDPPGPLGVPIFGNEFQIPSDKQWLRFNDWSKVYGNVVKFSTMGQPEIVISSAQIALDLLESRGSIYSDRPRAVMAGELVGWNRGLGYACYGERFKEFRRMFHHTIGPRPVQDYQSLQEKETARLLLRLLEAPDKFIEHARQSTGATILKLAYGYTVQSEDDSLVRIAEVAMQGFSKASEPGAFIVDRFPLLKHLPDWFPGSGFKRVAKAMRMDLERLYDVPFDHVMSEMVTGRYIPSFTSKYLTEKQDLTHYELQLVKAAAASLYSGGADTTPSSIASFILAMILYPDVQTKGQTEVDAIVGKGRLPSFSDRDSLPYVNAIVKEVLRWNPAVPLGLPHRVLEDDVYHGFKIRKGTIIWTNIWSMLHDEDKFPQPDEFKPERYLGNIDTSNDKTKDPSVLAFGFGRRICPGMHLADNSIFITVASLLSVFHFSKAKDADGKLVEPIVDFTGFISHPRPFKCDIRPRSEEAAKLVRCSASFG